MDANEQQEYWFPAKMYGWGWGLPTRWQGWLTLLVYLALMILNTIIFLPNAYPMEFFSGVGALSAAVVAVCYLKGAPPAWRWGKL